MRPYLAIIAVSAALASPAFASAPDDEVIATAQARPTAAALAAAAAQAPAPVVTTAVKPLTTQEQIAAFLAATPSPQYDDGPRGLLPADRDENGKRKIHGAMGVSVGTGGYRSAYASALIPVGETTTVGIAVSQTNFGKNGGYLADPYGYGPGYYDGYGGYGGYGYGRGLRARGGEHQSVALSVMSGGPGRGDGTPEGCAPGFRDGGRYVEPLWVEGLRDGAHPCAAAGPAR
ncbi:hypothetical protein [Caulobacter sp. 1776]|uniref:hypothetical protein n=1 Tax=Caulobacter sp. 1776 TaxID=3156420 RepID=UPI00339722AA